MNTEAVYKAIKAASEHSMPPLPAQYLAVLQGAMTALSSEPPELRPSNATGKPGGLVRLHNDIPTIIIPDLHARRGFLMALLASTPPAGFTTTSSASTPPSNSLPAAPGAAGTVFDLLAAGTLQILCLGDGFHAESRALDRWRSAYAEFNAAYREHQSMDQEMRESLGLMEMIMHAKAAFPGHFHFLKGNHENVLNETGNGNYGFYKFVQEGAMVRAYLDRFYGDAFVQAYAAFEKCLPLFAQGQRFLASHAEPARVFTENELINAALLPEVIMGLTWTGNDEALPGSVAAMLDHFLPSVRRPRYITGHHPIAGLFHERSGGLHLQIHNPDHRVVAWVRVDRDLEPQRDIGVVD
ncbi:MAG: hypothetical protein ABIJ86_15520 [Spirochaetota bacterium]